MPSLAVLRVRRPPPCPVQHGTKIEPYINPAKARGFTIPLSLLGRADEVID
jgi:hypothetical protein